MLVAVLMNFTSVLRQNWEIKKYNSYAEYEMIPKKICYKHFHINTLSEIDQHMYVKGLSSLGPEI
jgi:hypothetical protein